MILEFKEEMKETFEMMDLGCTSSLSRSIKMKGFSFLQKKYAENLLKKIQDELLQNGGNTARDNQETTK